MALASAARFGASTPLAKLLRGAGVSPWLLAGLLYFGSGMGLLIVLTARRLLGIASVEAPLLLMVRLATRPSTPAPSPT